MFAELRVYYVSHQYNNNSNIRKKSCYGFVCMHVEVHYLVWDLNSIFSYSYMKKEQLFIMVSHFHRFMPTKSAGIYISPPIRSRLNYKNWIFGAMPTNTHTHYYRLAKTCDLLVYIGLTAFMKCVFAVRFHKYV